MQRTTLAFVSALAAIGLAQGAAAATETGYDNPSQGGTPCVVVDRYAVSEANGSGYRAEALLQNLCARTMEVSFCFQYAEPVNDEARSCYSGRIRPWGASSVQEGDAPVRIVGHAHEWRYLEMQYE